MSFILPYLCEKRRIIITFLIFSAVFAVTFYLYRLPISAVLYPTALCLIFEIIIGAFSYVSDYKKHKMLVELKGEKWAIKRMRSPNSFYLNRMPNAIDVKRRLFQIDNQKELFELFDEYLEEYAKNSK